MIAIPKILNFDTDTPSLTIGISVYVKSVYFSQYLVPHNGRAVVPKGNIIPDEDTICMDFVAGELLDYEIKPLELCAPKFEERLKDDCEECDPCCFRCNGTGAGSCSPGAGRRGWERDDLASKLDSRTLVFEGTSHMPQFDSAALQLHLTVRRSPYARLHQHPALQASLTAGR